jgi:hypothetical protein
MTIGMMGNMHVSVHEKPIIVSNLVNKTQQNIMQHNWMKQVYDHKMHGTQKTCINTHNILSAQTT